MAKLLGSMSLKIRIILLVLLVFIGTVWGLALRVSSVLQADLQQMLSAQLAGTADYIANDINAELHLRSNLIAEIAAAVTPAMLDHPAALQQMLEQRLISPELFPNGIIIANRAGNVIADFPRAHQRVGRYIGDRQYFHDSMASSKVRVGEPVFSRFNNEPMITFSVQLPDANGIPAGILVAGISVNDQRLFPFQENHTLGIAARMMIVSARTNVVVAADEPQRIMQPLPAPGVNRLLDMRLKERIEGPGITLEAEGMEMLSVNRFIRLSDWMVIAGVPTQLAFAPIKTMQRQIYLTAVLMSLAIAGILFFILTRQLRPITDAAVAMRDMADAGNTLVPLPEGQDDEAGQLVSSFNHLVFERRRLYQALQESEQTLRKAQSVANIGSWKVDIITGKTIWSEQTYQIFGIPIGTPLTRDIYLSCVLPEDLHLVVNAWGAALHGTPYDVEHRFKTADGIHWARERAEVTFDDAGNPLVAIGTTQDITDSKVSEAYIEFLAYHDVLTKLPNRLKLRERLEHAMAHADRSQTTVALLFIDLDGFKSVNDSLGHLIGDALLKAVATRLRDSVRESETISRLGGDEFLIMLSDVSSIDAVAMIAEKILERMAQAFDIDGMELFATLSIGIAMYPEDGTDFTMLLQKADTAMYHAKEAGRNTYRFFAEQMNADASELLSMRNGLRRAIEHEEFVLYYQPQINLTSGELIGVEALIRWDHPELGILPAGRFIPTAEDCGLIIPIGEWVLKEACRQAVIWRKAGLPAMQISINLSAVQFRRGDLEKSITDALAESGLSPSLLELELTESVLIHDCDNVLSTVRRLKALGVKLAIDDFGTGYSSLAYLKRFAVDKLKIDQSFIRDLTSGQEESAIVCAIIQMAHSLNLTTIAEGVEDERIFSLLQKLHCDEVQGAYVSMPIAASEFPQFVESLSRKAA